MAKGYGKPTFGKAVAARLGVGDGYSYFPKKGVGGGPMSPFGAGRTRQQQLDAQERQTTDSNNR